MAQIDIYYHSDVLLHINSEAHPESPHRLRHAHHVLENDERLNDQLIWHVPEPIHRDKLHPAHTQQFVDDLFRRSPTAGFEVLDEDTTMNPHSLNASLLAAGALERACEQSMLTPENIQFCLSRPPGHHAESDKAMGFCLFNAIAIAALQCQQRGMKVVVVDFDVHHGNGSEAILANQRDIFFFSSFEHPLYPFSSLTPRAKNIFKYPLTKGSGTKDLREVYQGKVFPEIAKIKPDIILISAGFDAHQNDPLAELNWLEEDYYWLCSHLADLAHRYCQGRLVSILEGGYDVAALASSIQAHLHGLLGSTNYATSN